MPQNHSRTETNHAERSRSASARATHLGSEIFATADALRSQIGELRAKNVKASLRLQTEMFETFQAVSRDWVTRAASEAELALNLPNRLTKARSVPDAISAYQGWLNEWLTLCGEDGRSLFSDSQRIIDTGARCLASVTDAAARS
jgi:hypothetical protein